MAQRPFLVDPPEQALDAPDRSHQRGVGFARRGSYNSEDWVLRPDHAG
jgi:hypothetical protein